MKIRLSRHARRRMKLYDIQEKIITDALSDIQMKEAGRREIIKSISGFQFPMKIVFEIKEDEVMIVTAYPLKKGLKK